jgi:flagellar biosynthesis/type III secretory pathway protein FliH
MAENKIDIWLKLDLKPNFGKGEINAAMTNLLTFAYEVGFSDGHEEGFKKAIEEALKYLKDATLIKT